MASSDRSEVLIGICTLNEASNIEQLIESLRSSIPEAEILVVDDGSTDGTIQAVTSMSSSDPSINLIVRQDERGLGSATRLAMKTAIDRGCEFFLNLDGDLSHDPNQLPKLLQAARETSEVDVVIGSRYVAGGSIVGWPLHRRIMSRMVNRFATAFLRLPVRDCSGSMRCYRVSALQSLGLKNLHSDGYSVLEEVLVKLRRQGAEFAEVPITFTDRQRGESKLTFREAMRSVYRIVGLLKNPK